jgi:hypothetical protein
MEVILAFLIMPVLGLMGAALMFAGGDVRRTAGSMRLLTIAGRVVTGLLIVCCLGLFWIARGSLKEFHLALSIVGLLMVLSSKTVFRRAPRAVLSGLSLGGIALFAASLALKVFDESGWMGVARGMGWVALFLGGGVALGYALRLFDKRRERQAADPASLKETARS